MPLCFSLSRIQKRRTESPSRRSGQLTEDLRQVSEAQIVVHQVHAGSHHHPGIGWAVGLRQAGCQGGKWCRLLRRQGRCRLCILQGQWSLVFEAQCCVSMAKGEGGRGAVGPACAAIPLQRIWTFGSFWHWDFKKKQHFLVFFSICFFFYWKGWGDTFSMISFFFVGVEGGSTFSLISLSQLLFRQNSLLSLQGTLGFSVRWERNFQAWAHLSTYPCVPVLSDVFHKYGQHDDGHHFGDGGDNCNSCVYRFSH